MNAFIANTVFALEAGQDVQALAAKRQAVRQQERDLAISLDTAELELAQAFRDDHGPDIRGQVQNDIEILNEMARARVAFEVKQRELHAKLSYAAPEPFDLDTAVIEAPEHMGLTAEAYAVHEAAVAIALFEAKTQIEL